MGDIINAFPGYKYIPPYELPPEERKSKTRGANMFRGVDLKFGGYTYSEPGIYSNLALIDIQSMHPSSIVAMNYFGEYTPRFKEILDTRIAIKTGDFETARNMFGGELRKYLEDESIADALAQALKISINACYGLTSATFDNAMRDARNVNNIVALRGALFMKTLLDDLQEKGWTVAHLKVDSMKIPNATPEVVQYCQHFAKKYGYNFEHEAVYERMCLVDKANYVAAYMIPEKCEAIYGYVPSANKKHFKKHSHPWTATGDAFQKPYIFKTLFTGDPITFGDRCVSKSVKDAAIYLDENEGYIDVSDAEKELETRIFNKSLESNGTDDSRPRRLKDEWASYNDDAIREYISKGHNYRFVGRSGNFFPVREGVRGGWLVSKRNGKYDSVSGAKGYRWQEANIVKEKGLQEDYDQKFFEKMIDGAIGLITNLNKVIDPTRFHRFIDLSRPYEDPPKDIPEAPIPSPIDVPPWKVPCGSDQYNNCSECPNCAGDICKRGFSLASYIENGNMEDDELPF